MSQPTTAGNIAALDYFIGAWRAEAENPMNGERFTLDYTVAPLPGGQWYLGSGHAPKLGLHIHDVWGIDPISGDITRTIFDSQQTTGTVTSKGWSGDALVLQGDARAKQGIVTVRETITKVSASEFKAVWEMKTGETWTPYSVETLRRLQ